MLLEARSRQPARRRGSAPDRHRGRASSRARAASNCARRCRSPSSTSRPPAPPTPTPSSRPRSKALRRRRKCPRSPRRRRCSRRWRRRTRSRPRRRGVSSGGNCKSPTATRLSRRAALRRAGDDRSLRESARVGVGDKDAPERLAADYGLWAGSYVRGELPAMRAHAGDLPRATSRRDPIRPRPAVAHRAAGAYTLVRRRVPRSARASGTRARLCSNPAATTIWPFASDRTLASRRCFILRLYCGRWARSSARFPSSSAARRGSRASRMSTRAPSGKMHAAMFELMRGDLARAAPNAAELARLAREHDLPLVASSGGLSRGLWRRPKAARPAAGLRTCVAASNFCASRTS